MADYTLKQVRGPAPSIVLTGSGSQYVGQVGPAGPPSMLVLPFDAPIPPGTAPGTIIFRK
jgi:hypothetical protein